MTTFRTSIPDFELANPIYAGAVVSFYTVDANGAPTTTLATLYAGATGTQTVGNPQTLDGAGKFSAPVYTAVPVIGTVTSSTVASHSTGPINPRGTWRGNWATGTVYFSTDFIHDPIGGNTYSAVDDYTSGASVAADVAAGHLVLVINVTALTSVGALTVLANPTNAVADPIAVAAVAGSGAIFAESGSTLGWRTTLPGNYTWTGTQLFVPTTGNALTITPATGTVDKGFNVAQTTQTSGSAAGPFSLNQIAVIAQVNATGSGSFVTGFPANSINGLGIAFTTGGSNVGATFQSALASVIKMTTTGSLSTMYGSSGRAYITVANTNAGAGLGGAHGYAIVDSGGSIGVLEGMESETGILGTGTATNRGGIVLDSIGTKTASGIDAAVIVTTYTGWNGSTSAGAFGDFVVFSQAGAHGDTSMGSGIPLQATASLFRSDFAMNMANGLKFDNVTFSGDYFYFVDARLSATSGTKGWLTLGRNDVPDSPLTINVNTGTTGVGAVTAGTSIHAVGADSASNIAVLDAFANQNIFGGRRANGIRTAKTASVDGDIIVSLLGSGYDTSAYATAGSIDIRSTETWNGTAHGGRISFNVVAKTTTTNTEQMRLHGSGGLSVGNTNVSTDPGAGALLSTTATFSTSAATPLVIGGTAASSTLTLESTSGAGTTDAIIFKTGSQSERMRILTGGNVGINDSAPDSPLTINANTGATVAPTLNTSLHLVGADGAFVTETVDAFNNGGSAWGVQLVRASAGTRASKAALQADTFMYQFAAQAWDGSQYNTNAVIGFKTLNLQSGTDRSSKIIFQTIAGGVAGNPINNFAMWGSGGFSVGSANFATDPGAGGILATLLNTTGAVTAQNGTAIPAGGTAGAGYKFSSTSNFGVFFGSGAPTLSAAKGSLYLRSNGTTTNDRAYINTDGGTTWTALTTAA